MTALIGSRTGLADRIATVRRQQTFHHLRWLVAYGSVVMVGLMIAAFVWRRGGQPYLGASLFSLVALLLLWVRFPKVALNVTVFLVLVGDAVTVAWFPFVKNLSSLESIMFMSNSLIITPLEITIGVALALTVFRNLASSRRLLVKAPLNRPLALFLVFVGWGFLNGVGLGGDLRVAIFEARPLAYLFPLYLIVANTCDQRRDYRYLVGTAIAAVIVQAMLSLHFLSRLAPSVRENMEGLNQHGSAITMNLVFVALLAAFTYRSVPRIATFGLAISTIPIAVVYIASQRRAAVVALAAGVIYLIVSLFWRQRKTFFKFAPVLLVLGLGYLGAFWNSTSSAGFPAQAIKTVVAPDESSSRDQSSNLYREIENFDVWATIRFEPIRGIGFGKPFLRPIPLPDISNGFEFHPFFPHNSILWLWTKLGFAGFVTFLYVIGRGLMLGAHRVRHAPDGIDAVVQLVLSSFIAMYVIFMYVDIAWEPRNVTMLAVALAASTAFLRDEEESEPPSGPRLEAVPKRPERRHRATLGTKSGPAEAGAVVA